MLIPVGGLLLILPLSSYFTVSLRLLSRLAVLGYDLNYREYRNNKELL